MENPYKLTKEEKEIMREDWKKPTKKKVKQKSPGNEEREKLHLRHTVASRQKQRMSEDLIEFLLVSEISL